MTTTTTAVEDPQSPRGQQQSRVSSNPPSPSSSSSPADLALTSSTSTHIQPALASTQTALSPEGFFLDDVRINQLAPMRPRRRPRPLSVPTSRQSNSYQLAIARPTVPGSISPVADSEDSSSSKTTPTTVTRFTAAPTPPPTGPLPVPPFAMKMKMKGTTMPHHEDSIGWDAASIGSSYGDSRELLGLGSDGPSVSVVGGKYRLRRVTSSVRSGKASSDVLAEDDNEDEHEDEKHDHGHAGHVDNDNNNAGHAHAGPSTMTNQHRVNQSGEWSDISSNSLTGTDHRASLPLTEASANVLHHRLRHELRRVGDMSQLNGASNVRGSIMILTEDGVQFSGSERSSGQRMAENSQGSSEAVVYHPGSIPKIWTTETGVGRVTERGSFAASIRSTSEYGDAATDGDWETVAETGSRHNSIFFGHKPTGNSLAGGSSGSPSPDRAFFQYQHEPLPMVQHPADPRYEHVYRVRQTVPTGEPMLLPSYHFKGGAGFPNRNALTPPYPSSPVDTTFEQTAPLTNHAHPFQSSPPMIQGKGRMIQGKGRKVSARGDDGLHALDEAEPFSYGPPGAANPAAARLNPGIRVVESSSSEAEALRQFDFGVDSDKRGPNGLSVTEESSSQSNVDDSFAKSFLLGVKRNITGTPRGSGMREVGSSLAAESSISPTQWPRQRYYDGPVSPHHVPPFAPGRHSALDFSQGITDSSNSTRLSERLYESLRAHRRVLAAEGLLPEAISPARLRPSSDDEINQMMDMQEMGGRNNQMMNMQEMGGRNNQMMNMQEMGGRNNQMMEMQEMASRNSSQLMSPLSPSTYLEAFARPFSYNQTPALPRPASDRFADFDYRLRRVRRDDSSVVTVLAKRKKGISWVTLVMCFLLLPPLLLYYWMGKLDDIMLAATKGQIEHFGRREKKLALYGGCVWGVAVTVGAAVGLSMV